MIQEKVNQALGMAGIATQLYKQTPEYQEKMRIKGLETEREKLYNITERESQQADIAKTNLGVYTELLKSGGHLDPSEVEDLKAYTRTFKEYAGKMDEYYKRLDELDVQLGQTQTQYQARVDVNKMNLENEQMFDLANAEVRYQANMQAQKKREANKQRKAYAQTYASDSGFANYLRGFKGPVQGGNK